MRGLLPYFIVLIFVCLFFSSCSTHNRFLDKTALLDERLPIANTGAEKRSWSTNDLSIHYTVKDVRGRLTFNGFVEIKDSISSSFSRSKYLSIYVYLLNGDGKATSRHTIHPQMASYNMLQGKSDFTTSIPRDESTTSFAFGYWGSFMDTEPVRRKTKFMSNVSDWEIYHTPFL